jgi:hypothetical protein
LAPITHPADASDVGSTADESIPPSDTESDNMSNNVTLPPRRIKVIGPRHPTQIWGVIDTLNILPFSRTRRQAVFLTTAEEEHYTPKNYKDAVSCSNKEDWLVAIEKELANMKDLNVWEAIPRLPSHFPIPCVWVFRNKIDANGKIVERKARLCAQGFLQKQGVDFEQTVAPTG